MFVFGSNDMYSPVLKNPARYLWRTSKRDVLREESRPAVGGAGRAHDRRGLARPEQPRRQHQGRRPRLHVGGIHDSHIDRDRYDAIAGPAPPTPLRIGVMHSPEPRNLTRFAADGYQLLLAGHTHGGQLCVPFYGALVTNCGIDRARVKGLHRHGAAWLHVSAGLGTSPYAPVRFSCPPEATLLTLVARRARGEARAPPESGRLSEAKVPHRGVAQLGSALRSGRRGRGFKSRHPDQREGRL